MALKIFNSLSRSKELFEPISGNRVGLYTCGPTVYNYPHIGNYRAYIFADILKRHLKYSGYDVQHVMNITDVDDKTIRDSKAQGKTLKEFTEFYTKEFLQDCTSLGILAPDVQPKATDKESIDGMIRIIKSLMEKGYAYKGGDNSIYFDIRCDKEYGKLSRFTLSDLKDNADGRLKKDEYDKDNAQDFALWKAWDENDGDVYWDTDLGRGRPGWHIECSAMSSNALGDQIDLHTGGVDLIFPHHENEIAQSECATGKQFSKYFMHNEHLLVDGSKMSKSAGNFYTLRDLIEKGINPLSFRMWLYGAHYQTRINFTLDACLGAQTAHKRLIDAFQSLDGHEGGIVNAEYKKKLIDFMDDDLDTPQALALLWQLVRDTEISDADKHATLLDFDYIFGFGLSVIEKLHIPNDIIQLAQAREQARNDKDWTASDMIRIKIEEAGYTIKDTDTGYKISKL